MDNVTHLQTARERRARRRRALAARAVTHPSLRWLAGDDVEQAHRRDETGRPACGAAGILTLAGPEVLLCGTCYPRAG